MRIKGAISKLLTGFTYLRVEHSEKRTFDYVFPLFLTIGLLVISLAFPLPVFGQYGILDICNNFVAVLPGFFLAALTAVATFDRPSMDQLMEGRAPILRGNVRKNGQASTTEKLTRRRFLCFMFGYLTLNSFVLFFIGVLANFFYPSLSRVVTGFLAELLRGTFLVVYGFIFFNMLCTTLLGLHFLTERIHRYQKLRVEQVDPDSILDEEDTD